MRRSKRGIIKTPNEILGCGTLNSKTTNTVPQHWISRYLNEPVKLTLGARLPYVALKTMPFRLLFTGHEA